MKLKMKNSDILRIFLDNYSYSHEGLEAFWGSSMDEIDELPSNGSDTKPLQELDEWLDGPGRVLLLESRDSRSCTLLLARWALALGKAEKADIAFLPVSPCFGTAIEREALQILFGALPACATAMFSNPCTPQELRLAIRIALSCESEPEDKLLLAIIDGIDRATDWRLDMGLPFLGEIGDGKKLVVSFHADGKSQNMEKWRKQLVPSGIGAATMRIPKNMYSQSNSMESDSGIVAGIGDFSEPAGGIADALCVAMAPVSCDGLLALCGIPKNILTPADIEKHLLGKWIVQNANGTLRFANDDVRSEWAAKLDEEKLDRAEKRIVEYGLQVLSTMTYSEDDAALEYMVRYLGAHMVRRHAPLRQLMLLASPLWMKLWMGQPNSLVGYLTDVRWARRVAEKDLCLAADVEKRLLALRDLLRCVVVEASLLDKGRVEPVDAEEQAKYKAPRIDLTPSERVGRRRVELIVSLAEVVDEPERSEMRMLVDTAKKACAGCDWTNQAPTVHPVPGRHLPETRPVPEHIGLDSLEDIRLETIDSLDDGYEALFLNYTSAICARFGWERTLALVRKTHGISRITGLAELVPYLPQEERPSVVKELMEDYWRDGDEDMLRSILGCAQWMSDADAIRLLCTTWDCNHFLYDFEDFEEFLVGWGGLVDLAPIFLRLGGPRAIVEAASAVVEVGEWLG